MSEVCGLDRGRLLPVYDVGAHVGRTGWVPKPPALQTRPASVSIGLTAATLRSSRGVTARGGIHGPRR